jgi:hypothetical protein
LVKYKIYDIVIFICCFEHNSKEFHVKDTVAAHSAGVVGAGGIVIGKSKIAVGAAGLIPTTPAEWLIFLSTIVVVFQLSHYLWRFFKFLKRGK